MKIVIVGCGRVGAVLAGEFDATAAHDHDLHAGSSGIGSRTTHTAQGAFFSA